MTYDEGKQLGNYQLLKLLGQGGFADVYLGEHIYLKTSAAIKVLRMQLSAESFAPFLAEARTIARLRHPHIVMVHDFGIEQEIPFLVMSYAPYGSLRRLHPIGSSVPLDLVTLYVKQMAQALHYAHEQMIIHRDVKPENMLVDEQKALVLSDFGIAVTLQGMPSNPGVATAHLSETVGTTTYMAPELFTSEASFACDQYSLAIAAYEWLSGTPPFVGSDMEIALQHVHISPPSLCDKVLEVPLELEAVIMRALSKNPQDRYSSMQDFAVAFEHAAQRDRVHIDSTPVPPHLSALALSSLPPASTSDKTEVVVSPVQSMSVQDLSLSGKQPQLLRFGKPGLTPQANSSKLLTSQPSDTVSRHLEVSLPPNSLKLPAAQSNSGTRRFLDYASSPGLQPLSDAVVKDDQTAGTPALTAKATVVLTDLKQKWTEHGVPAVKHLWMNKAVPAVKKVFSIPLLSPNQQELLPPLLPSSSQRLAMRPLPPSRNLLLATQSVRAAPPPIQAPNTLLARRRIVIGGLASVLVAGVVGGSAIAAIEGKFQPVPAVPTPIPVRPHHKSAPPTATVVPSTPTPVSQNPTVLNATRPSVVSGLAGQLDIFVRGTDGGLWQRHYDGTWHAWTLALNGLAFDPVVTSWGAGRLDAFARGADNTLQHAWYDGSWHAWESLGGTLTTDPSVVAWGPGRLDVFARSTDNALWHKAFDGSWHDWDRLDGVLLSSPSAASWGVNRLDVFVRGTDSALWHRGYDGSWHNWESLGGSFESDPAAVSVGLNHLDVFVRGVGNVLQRINYDGTWHAWETLGGVMTSSPAATVWEPGRIDVFSRTINNLLQQTYYQAGSWQAWAPLN
ncbi:protein kinase domain-containing protein [Dictyobacter arantiisoli]|uniref:non-specific serine/threonine protein kinase n=1 Tax=Dictyobacter arantiisoli TaxID=2014874 RepID=A0A5A5TEJ7_9CHLR|nr:protein kinase [Dictyobacter arantiisoli]GCF09655.1 hypothetical protein KDI_32190 [Dictyobacter arantiisoli]